MTYAQALSQIAAGGFVARAHWCWVMLRPWPAKAGLCLEHDDGKRERWRPTAEDRAATDWDDHFGFQG